ncbi:MAG: DUF1772 domain-containing protein [Paracoccaceae bacterium]
MSTWFFLLSQFSILSFALVGGVFLAFSDFIMRSLALAQAPGGIDVMQAVNREVFRWVFMALFLGMAAVSVVVIAYAWFNLTGPAAGLIAGAALVYLVGVFGVTVLFNVPLNDALAGLEAGSETARQFWESRYLPRWTFWNSVRTAGSVLAAALYLFGLLWAGQG